jgi:hypothetical protein
MFSAFPPAKYLAPLCHEIWPSEDTILQITGIPMLFLSGLQDEIVPYVYDFFCGLETANPHVQSVAYVSAVPTMSVSAEDMERVP